jgi:predicted nucleic acid-binding protein
VWKLRHNVSIHDAAYLAVAALHDAPLVTFDARLAEGALQAMPEVTVTVL